LAAISSAFSAARRREASRIGMWLVPKESASAEMVSVCPGSKRPVINAWRSCR